MKIILSWWAAFLLYWKNFRTPINRLFKGIPSPVIPTVNPRRPLMPPLAPILPPVTVRVPMPAGAALPAPSRPAPAPVTVLAAAGMNLFLQAVAREEGWLDLKSRPRRNNNPGDIEYGRYALGHGATGTDGRFAIFPTPELGFAAMLGLFQTPAYIHLTVAAAIEQWAPATENDTTQYTQNVCAWANCFPNDPLAAVLAA